VMARQKRASLKPWFIVEHSLERQQHADDRHLCLCGTVCSMGCGCMVIGLDADSWIGGCCEIVPTMRAGVCLTAPAGSHGPMVFQPNCAQLRPCRGGGGVEGPMCVS
jgi:hypothetical protein